MSKNNQQGTAADPDMEKLAQSVAEKFTTLCTKLKELKPEISRIQEWFRNHQRGSVTLSGCRSFKEYCEQRLNRTEQAVYAMLGDKVAKKKTMKHVAESEGKAESKTVALDPVAEDVERMRTGLNAVARAKAAEAKGKKEEAAEAWKEYETIAQAEPLKSRIDGDQPNHRMLLFDLLSEIEKNGERIMPVAPMLMRKVTAMRKRLQLDNEALGLHPTAVLQKEQQKKCRPPVSAFRVVTDLDHPEKELEMMGFFKGAKEKPEQQANAAQAGSEVL